jgi:imidazolonepropionase-like amidohydrolase
MMHLVDMWGYKFEAMDGNVRAAQILGEAGIPVAFKSDHPVLTAVSFASCYFLLLQRTSHN